MVGSILFLYILVHAYLKWNRDTSVSLRSTHKKEIKKVDAIESKGVQVSSSVKSMLDNSMAKELESQKKNQGLSHHQLLNIKFKAKQVIKREGLVDNKNSLSMGSNFIGKLLTSIDTREEGQLYKVLLPYGGKSKNGNGLPKETILFGKIRYSGKGEKVFLSFKKALLPDGSELDIDAQALSSKDYSPGIVGEYHGKAGSRLTATLGLTMLSGATEVLTEKQALSNQGDVVLKSNIKNALYSGLSKSAEFEANRQASELANEPEYVTIDAGKDLIVNLTRRINFE